MLLRPKVAQNEDGPASYRLDQPATATCNIGRFRIHLRLLSMTGRLRRADPDSGVQHDGSPSGLQHLHWVQVELQDLRRDLYECRNAHQHRDQRQAIARQSTSIAVEKL